ncbi:MAG TPA: choice-of-anchor D domain-containing protein [Conexibacter sp.]|nr:choice-of-anchor D domain-containing protein [Conexibacter sp.]
MTTTLRLLTAALAAVCAVALFAPAAGAWPPRPEAGSIRLPEQADLGQQRVGTTGRVDVSFVASPTDAVLTGVAVVGPDAGDFRVTALRGKPRRALISFVRETFRVEFRPTSLGPKRARLVVSMFGGPPRATATRLSGIGVGPSAALAPGSLDFPPTVAGRRSEPQIATLSNTGVDPVTITRLQLRGRFTLKACGRLPYRIAPGQHCEIALRFLPRSAGDVTGALTVHDTAPGGPRTVELTGTGLSRAPPRPGSEP